MNAQQRYGGICECGDHAWCRLTRGYITLVSPEDAHIIQGTLFRAAVQNSGRDVYALANCPRKADGSRGTWALHRMILSDDPDQHVDHINGNTLDNRRRKIRRASRSQNGQNRRRYSAPQFKGVAKNGFGYQAYCGGEYLGFYRTPEEAARIYDVAARINYGEFACLNFPKSGENGVKL